MGVSRFDQLFKPSRMRAGVVVECREQGGFGGTPCLVHGLTESCVLSIGDHADTIPRELRRALDTARAAIVDDDDFEIRIGLGFQGV